MRHWSRAYGVVALVQSNAFALIYIDRQTDGRMDGWTDIRTDGHNSLFDWYIAHTACTAHPWPHPVTRTTLNYNNGVGISCLTVTLFNYYRHVNIHRNTMSPLSDTFKWNRHLHGHTFWLLLEKILHTCDMYTWTMKCNPKARGGGDIHVIGVSQSVTIHNIAMHAFTKDS